MWAKRLEISAMAASIWGRRFSLDGGIEPLNACADEYFQP